MHQDLSRQERYFTFISYPQYADSLNLNGVPSTFSACPPVKRYAPGHFPLNYSAKIPMKNDGIAEDANMDSENIKFCYY
jgi:hypothetical protein